MIAEVIMRRTLVLVALFGLASCGQNGTPAPAESTNETPETMTVPPDVGGAVAGDLFPRSVIPPHGAQLSLAYADTLQPGSTGPLVPIYAIKIPFSDQTPPWTVVNATAPPAGWTETITSDSYCVSTTTDPLQPGTSLQFFFSYNTTTRQEAAQFQTGPVKLMDQAGEDIGTADMLYR